MVYQVNYFSILLSALRPRVRHIFCSRPCGPRATIFFSFFRPPTRTQGPFWVLRQGEREPRKQGQFGATTRPALSPECSRGATGSRRRNRQPQKGVLSGVKEARQNA